MKGTMVLVRAWRKEAAQRAARNARALFGGALGALSASVVGVLLAVGGASAATFPNLYTLTVTPGQEAGNARQAAIDEAMRRLLVRITGEREPESDPALQSVIEDASRFVASVAVGFDRERTRVEFYPDQVNRQLAALNKRIWGPERPLTLLWIAVDAGTGERVLLSADGVGGAASATPELVDQAAAIREAIDAVADERALPLALPLLDLEDLSAVTFADIWGGFIEPVRAASSRYGADAALIGRVLLSEFGTSVQWILVRGDERRTFSGTEFVEGLHWLADTYAADFSVLGDAQTVRLLVRGVASYADYGRVMSYLENLSALQSIDVEGYEAGVLSLRASARGDAGVLERTLALGRVLELDRGTAAVQGNTLVMRVARGSGP